MTNWRPLAALLLIVALPTVIDAQEWGPTTPTPRADIDQRAARPQGSLENIFSINAALLTSAQWVAKGDVARGNVFGSGSLDVTITVRPTDSMRIFLDVEGLAGQGPDKELGTLSRLNKNADDVLGGERALRLMKLIVRPSWLEERILLSVGKLDMEDYFDRNAFAEDEEQQFLLASLNTNLLLGQPPNNSVGMAIRANYQDWRFGFGVAAMDDVGSDMSGLPFIIAELGRRNLLSLRGHYRVWARVSSQFDHRDRVTWGVGVSIDQLLTPDIGLFFRGALARNDGESLTSTFWATGLQFTPTWIGRAKDAIGIGFSGVRDVPGTEHAAEAYYRVVMADWLSLIANVQWIMSGTNAVTGKHHSNVVVPGLRALLSF